MHIKKLIVKNFKMFSDRTFEFNKDLNLLVGDNESGKSTILEAIEVALNCSYRGKPLSGEIKPDLFNNSATQIYLDSDKSPQYLPTISIEVYMEDLPEYRGEVNSLKTDSDGASVSIKFDVDLQDAYEELIKTPDLIRTVPVEFYKFEWFDFGWNEIKFLNKKMSSLFVDPSRLHPSHGRNQYISRIINTTLKKEEQALLSVNYRQLKQHFNEQPQVKSINDELDADNVVTNKKLEVVADISATRLETGMQLAIDDVIFPQIGKGEQNTIQIKLAIQNRAKNSDVILLEEPENHLSHTNLAKLVKYIDSKSENKQLFIATHSSYILNKLSLEKLCLINDGYTRLNDIDPKIANRLKRLPGYDTLRVVLSQMVVLVEGPSDELILKRNYFDTKGKLPEDDGIDIIVVRGIGFKNYLAISTKVGTRVNVLKDNDGDHKKNIEEYASFYDNYENINFFSAKDNNLYSLEPTLIYANNSTEAELDAFAKIALSTETYNKYKLEASLSEKESYLVNWYSEKGGAGKKKVDSAMRIFESEKKIKYPEFLQDALCFE